MLARIEDFLVGGKLVAIEDVFLDCVVEEERLLLHEAQVGPVLTQIVLLDVDAVNQDLTELWLVESKQQEYDR